ncbi:MAG: hypothetical protein HKO95_06835 [Rhodobacteraceae bacterium]|nr:hypothetical protein [Alphaproteobacteria bacterium]NNK66435.1 hypothetical protein [Paracoccaceae bacterium]
MSDRGEPMFLARETYRRRRLMDAARILPFLGAFLFLIPLLMGTEAGTSISKIYLFLAWLVLILLAFVVSRRLAANVDLTAEEGEDG